MHLFVEIMGVATLVSFSRLTSRQARNLRDKRDEPFKGQTSIAFWTIFMAASSTIAVIYITESLAHTWQRVGGYLVLVGYGAVFALTAMAWHSPAKPSKKKSPSSETTAH